MIHRQRVWFVVCALLFGASCGESREAEDRKPALSKREEAKQKARAERRGRRLAGRPRIVIEPCEIDFGRVLAGRKVQRGVSIENRGTVDLVIEGLRVGCGCVEARVASETIPPGQSTELTISFLSEGGVGQEEKEIRVLSNDPMRPGLGVFFEVEVFRLIDVEPSSLDFGEVLEGSGAQRQLRLSATDGEQFKVSGVECSDPYLDARWENEGSRAQVFLTLSDQAPRGWPSKPQRLFINLEHSAHHRFKVPISGRVVPPVRLHPTMVDFGEFPQDDVSELRVLVQNLKIEKPCPAPLVKVVCRGNNLRKNQEGEALRFVSAQVLEQEVGQRWEIVVRVEAGFPLKTLSGRLEIRVGNEGPPRSLPLLGQRAEG